MALDDEMLDAVRRYVGPGVLDRLAACSRPPEDQAMTIDPQEVRRTGAPAGIH